MNHPASQLGGWLKARRQKQGQVARVFAGQIELSPAEYAEAEAGVGRWLGPDQERLVVEVLSPGTEDRLEFRRLLNAARQAAPLEFADIARREQLESMRLRREGRRRLTESDKKDILDVVFTPLA